MIRDLETFKIIKFVSNLITAKAQLFFELQILNALAQEG